MYCNACPQYITDQMVSVPGFLGIRIVAWLAILGGVWTLLGSLAVFVFAWSMPAPPDPADAPWQVRLLYGLFRYARLVALLQVVLAAVLVWAGVGLLRLRASARAALEGLSWLGLLYVAAVGAFWWLAWTAFPDLPQDRPELGQTAERIEIALMALTLLLLALPAGAALWYLRRPDVRALVRHDGTVGPR